MKGAKLSLMPLLLPRLLLRPLLRPLLLRPLLLRLLRRLLLLPPPPLPHLPLHPSPLHPFLLLPPFPPLCRFLPPSLCRSLSSENGNISIVFNLERDQIEEKRTWIFILIGKISNWLERPLWIDSPPPSSVSSLEWLFPHEVSSSILRLKRKEKANEKFSFRRLCSVGQLFIFPA